MNTKNITSLIDMLQPKPAPRRCVHRCAVIQPDGEKIPFEFCEEEPGPAVLRELIESPEFGVPRKRIPLALGCQNERNFIIPDLADLPHLLVAGHYATEISAARRTLLLTLHLHQQAGKLRLDYLNCSTDNAGCLPLLQEAAREALTRVRFLTWAGVESMDAFNTRTPETLRIPSAAALLPERMERWVILLHDPGHLIRSAGKEAMNALTLLCQATRCSYIAPRDAGIHLVITCDNPTCRNLPTALLQGLPARAVFHSFSRKRLLPGIPTGQKRLRDGEFFYKAHKDAPCLTAMLPISTPEEFEAVLQYRMSRSKDN